MVKSNGLGYAVSCRASNPPKEQQPPREKKNGDKKEFARKRKFLPLPLLPTNFIRTRQWMYLE
jgi:hypothetical protein